MTGPEKAGLGLIALVVCGLLGAVLVALFEGDNQAGGQTWARSCTR